MIEITIYCRKEVDSWSCNSFKKNWSGSELLFWAFVTALLACCVMSTLKVEMGISPILLRKLRTEITQPRIISTWKSGQRRGGPKHEDEDYRGNRRKS